jgi:hypothetical protein
VAHAEVAIGHDLKICLKLTDSTGLLAIGTRAHHAGSKGTMSISRPKNRSESIAKSKSRISKAREAATGHLHAAKVEKAKAKVAKRAMNRALIQLSQKNLDVQSTGCVLRTPNSSLRSFFFDPDEQLKLKCFE